MELLQYTSRGNRNLFKIEAIIVGFVIFAVFINLSRINLIHLIAIFAVALMLVILFFINKWSMGGKKIIKYGDGEYIFSDDGINIATKKKNSFLLYGEINWVNYSFEKFRGIESLAEIFAYGIVGYFINRLLHKKFPTSQMIEMKLVDGTFAYIPAPPIYVSQAIQILKQKIKYSE